jgi:DNA-binding LytR/AlgR family response regulator
LLSIAIYSDCNLDTEQLKSIIQDFLIEMKMMAKVSYFNDPEALILAPSSFDIYIMDMDSEADLIELSCKMRTIDAGAKYIFISSNENHAYKVTKARFNYFMLKPIEAEELI